MRAPTILTILNCLTIGIRNNACKPKFINVIFNKIRKRILVLSLSSSPMAPEKEEFEADESYLRTPLSQRQPWSWSSLQDYRVRSLQAWRQGVHRDKSLTSKATLSAIIRGRADIESDGWRGYDGLVDL